MNKITESKRLKSLPAKLTLRGRCFTRAELKIVRKLTKKFYIYGRTRISVEVCLALGWKQPNGWLKDRACRDVLRSLDVEGFIHLPEAKIDLAKLNTFKANPCITTTAAVLIVTQVSGPIVLHMAKGNKDEGIWNEIMEKHHYLGHKVTVGKCIKFLIKSGNMILGGISLAERAWAVRDRDIVCARLGIGQDEIANNGRFLILPNVQVKNLASRVLALLARDGVREWERYYSVRLRCLETFVDSSRFTGTSYKAANWIQVGQTQGYRKSGAQHFNSNQPKYIFLYPLETADRILLRKYQSRRSEIGSTKVPPHA